MDCQTEWQRSAPVAAAGSERKMACYWSKTGHTQYVLYRHWSSRWHIKECCVMLAGGMKTWVKCEGQDQHRLTVVLSRWIGKCPSWPFELVHRHSGLRPLEIKLHTDSLGAVFLHADDCELCRWTPPKLSCVCSSDGCHLITEILINILWTIAIMASCRIANVKKFLHLYVCQQL
jgi:hypothetical protein